MNIERNQESVFQSCAMTVRQLYRALEDLERRATIFQPVPLAGREGFELLREEWIVDRQQQIARRSSEEEGLEDRLIGHLLRRCVGEKELPQVDRLSVYQGYIGKPLPRLTC